MAKHTYILEHDYFTADARLYKRGEKIVLDEKDSAVKLCAPLGVKSLSDSDVADTEEIEAEKPKKKSRKKNEPSIFD